MKDLIDRKALMAQIEYEVKKADTLGRCITVAQVINLINQAPAAWITVAPTITNEAAIDHLQKSGWMARHDEAMVTPSLAQFVNGVMERGDKSITFSIYPVLEGGS